MLEKLGMVKFRQALYIVSLKITMQEYDRFLKITAQECILDFHLKNGPALKSNNCQNCSTLSSPLDGKQSVSS